MPCEEKNQDVASSRGTQAADSAKSTAQKQNNQTARRCCKRRCGGTSSRSDNEEKRATESPTDFKIERRRKKTKLRHSFGLGRFLFQSPEKEPWCPIRRYCEAKKELKRKSKAKADQVITRPADVENIIEGISKL